MNTFAPLALLELRGLFGLNRLRHTKDRKAKGKAAALFLLYVLVAAVMATYAGFLAYGLCLLGAGEAALPYLITITTLLLFFFGILKAGSVLFSLGGYESLSALPLPQSHIVMSRFLRMYVEDLPIALIAILPGLLVYGRMVKPGPGYYLLGLLAVLVVPLLPLAVATLLGAAVTALASRMKHKSLATTLLSLLLILVILGASFALPAGGEELLDPDVLLELSNTVIRLLGKLYPPALWLGSGRLGPCLAGAALSLAVFGGVVALTSARFRSVCLRLNATSARHDYRLAALKSQSRHKALLGREFRRYFASSVYVTNTLVGPILGLFLAAGLFFTGVERLEALLGLSLDLHSGLPFLVALPFAMMPPTAVSISMEGKQWWIAKSLPLSTGDILKAKLLMTLLLELPFYLAAQVLLLLALAPPPGEALWLVFIPGAAILFSALFALTVNLHFPVLEWENETRIVKQSAASVLGGLGGTLLPLLGLASVFLLPGFYESAVKGLFCLLSLAFGVLLYRHCLGFDLSRL